MTFEFRQVGPENGWKHPKIFEPVICTKELFDSYFNGMFSDPYYEKHVDHKLWLCPPVEKLSMAHSKNEEHIKSHFIFVVYINHEFTAGLEGDEKDKKFAE